MPDALIDAHYAAKIGALGLALYTVLRRRADGQGYCWPSHDTMAQESGMSKASVKRVLKVLRQHGLITWQACHSAEGDPDANTYHLLPVGGWGQADPRGGVRLTLGVGSDRPQGGVRLSSEGKNLKEGSEVEGGDGAVVRSADQALSPPEEERVHPEAETTTQDQTPASAEGDETPQTWEATTLPGRAKELWQGWQDICTTEGLPAATWTPDLERHLIAAVKKYPAFDLWQKALDLMSTDPYFKSRKAQGWENTLHWLAKDDHVYQVVNGYFTRRRQTG